MTTDTPLSGIRVYTRHVRQCGFCLTPGGRDWAELHGIIWRDFVKNGVPVETLESINDSFATRVAARARAEESK